jgi:hypothetical protein
LIVQIRPTDVDQQNPWHARDQPVTLQRRKTEDLATIDPSLETSLADLHLLIGTKCPQTLETCLVDLR